MENILINTKSLSEIYNFLYKRRLHTSQAIDRRLHTSRTQQHLQQTSQQLCAILQQLGYFSFKKYI
jgi:guanylate kinase